MNENNVVYTAAGFRRRAAARNQQQNGSRLVLPHKNFLLHRSEAIRFIGHGSSPFTPLFELTFSSPAILSDPMTLSAAIQN